MPYSNKKNYTPDSFSDIMMRLMEGVNAQFKTTFVYETFVGSGFYKFFYAPVQELLAAENTFAEAYAKLQDFIRTTNERIAIPKTPREGLIETFAKAGFVVSLEPQNLDNAGKLGVCVLVDASAEDFVQKKDEILKMLKEYTVAGLYYNGDQRGNVRLSNGQNFEFAFYTPLKSTVSLKLTLKLSKNTTILADKENEIKAKLLKNLAELYRLGNNFEPSKYFTISRDAPYASEVLLEYKIGEAAFTSAVYEANFKDLFVFAPERIEVVIS